MNTNKVISMVFGFFLMAAGLAAISNQRFGGGNGKFTGVTNGKPAIVIGIALIGIGAWVMRGGKN